MSFSFVVPDIYPTQGIQKVKGFGRGYHMNNSVRIGISRASPASRLVKIWLYCHVNGEVKTALLATEKVGTIIKCELTMLDDCFTCTIINWTAVRYTKSIKRQGRKLFPIGYDLGQYFEYDGQNFESPMVDVNGDKITIEVY